MLTKILDSLKLFGQKVCDRNTMPCGIVSSESAIISRLNLPNMPSISKANPLDWLIGPDSRGGSNNQYHWYLSENCKVMATTLNPGSVVLTKVPHSTPSNLRYLPWNENIFSGMVLDNEATEFTTGAFTGCTFFMCVDETQQPIILHSNTNQFAHITNSQERRTLTRAQQRLDAEGYLQAHHPGAIIRFMADYHIWPDHHINMKGRMGWVVGVVSDNDRSVWDICYVVVRERLKPWQRYCFSLGTANLK